MGEDLTVFIADFGDDCLLDSEQVRAIVDTETMLDGAGLLTEGPSAVLLTSDASTALAGQSFADGDGDTYTVRQVVREPPDGRLTRLVLVRT